MSSISTGATRPHMAVKSATTRQSCRASFLTAKCFTPSTRRARPTTALRTGCRSGSKIKIRRPSWLFARLVRNEQFRCGEAGSMVVRRRRDTARRFIGGAVYRYVASRRLGAAAGKQSLRYALAPCTEPQRTWVGDGWACYPHHGLPGGSLRASPDRKAPLVAESYCDAWRIRCSADVVIHVARRVQRCNLRC